MSVLTFLKKLVDPTGPIGEVVSPAAVYKERLGLPISSPHAQRLRGVETSAQVERALAPARYVSVDEAKNVPKDRVRQVSAFVEEVWEPIYQRTDATDWATILRAGQTLIGWAVKQRVRAAYCDCTTARFERDANGEHIHRACGRGRRHLSAEQFQEVVQNLQFAPQDDLYNVYLETVKGNDPVVIDGKVLTARDGTVIRGGTQIKHGRAEYRRKTAGMAHWDKGFVQKRNQALAEEASRPVRNVQRALEAVKGEKLPSYTVLPNPVRDRKAV